jgi:hypothetical protein
MKKVFQFLLLILSVSISIYSCRRDVITTDSNDKLSFSSDSIFFDTVFATVGSSTHSFKVYNKHSKKIKISSISLKNGSNSYFILNVDGVAGSVHHDVEIEANDSIFIFAEVTIDPANTNTPYVVEEQVVFETNTNIQMVNLIAWGQRAIFHRPKPGYSAFAVGNETWNSDTPHVVYGIAVVDSGYKLTISKGAQVHFHGGSTLYVNKHATLEIKGTINEQVVLQGDRLDPSYEEIPGQWNGIYLSPLSTNNKIMFAVIKNATIGIQADTVNGSNLTLELRNSWIRNMSKIGLFGRGTSIKAYNTVISNCGTYCVAFTIGGSYQMDHCTIGNYWSSSYGERKTGALIINNWFQSASLQYIPRDLSMATFNNCIVYGNLIGELNMSKIAGAQFNYLFNHCILKVDPDKVVTTGAEYVNCKINQDPLFENSENDYHLKENSPALKAADKSIASSNLIYLRFDAAGTDRLLGSDDPDIGAWEK